MTRVLFLAYHFPPNGGAAVQRNAKFARYLPELGYEPVVVTGPGPSTDRWTPRDDTLEHDLPEGLEIHRIAAHAPPASTGLKRRTERLLARRPPWESWWVEAALAAGLRAGPETDVIYASLVPYETADAAAQLSLRLGIPWVADLQDPWALDEMWLYPSGTHRRRDLQRMERLLSTAEAVIMNTPEAVLRVARHLPRLAERLTPAIPNGFDAADFACPAPLRAGSVFRIAHTGYLHTALGRRQRKTAAMRRFLGGEPVPGVDILTRSHVFLLAALDELRRNDPTHSDTLELHLAGSLTPADLEVVDGHPLVHLHGYMTHGETVDLMRSADLLFLPMQDLPGGVRAGIVPGKTYEYLASGTPILAAVPDGDARDALDEIGTARLCRPGDVGTMVAAIEAEVERWRSGASPPAPNPDVLARYERRHLTRQLARVLENVLDGRAPAEPPRSLPARSPTAYA